jgi:hypothetical protein
MNHHKIYFAKAKKTHSKQLEDDVIGRFQLMRVHVLHCGRKRECFIASAPRTSIGLHADVGAVAIGQPVFFFVVVVVASGRNFYLEGQENFFNKKQEKIFDL